MIFMGVRAAKTQGLLHSVWPAASHQRGWSFLLEMAAAPAAVAQWITKHLLCAVGSSGVRNSCYSAGCWNLSHVDQQSLCPH